VLKTVGRLPDAVAAYRRAVGIEPGFGEAWWSLANLKIVKLDEADRAAMEQALEREDLAPRTGSIWSLPAARHGGCG
jgi:cytochrome c-type biogenesis protein CcmH/NrfG